MGGISSDPRVLLANLIEAVSRAVAGAAPRKLVEQLSRAAADLTFDLTTGQAPHVKAGQKALAGYYRWLGAKGAH